VLTKTEKETSGNKSGNIHDIRATSSSSKVIKSNANQPAVRQAAAATCGVAMHNQLAAVTKAAAVTSSDKSNGNQLIVKKHI